jgi:hypothetical protein
MKGSYIFIFMLGLIVGVLAHEADMVMYQYRIDGVFKPFMFEPINCK